MQHRNMPWEAADEVHPACTSLTWLPPAVLALVSLILSTTLSPTPSLLHIARPRLSSKRRAPQLHWYHLLTTFPR